MKRDERGRTRAARDLLRQSPRWDMADERNREMEDARRGEEMPGAQSGAGTARDREMGREAEPLGDRGRGNHTWEPPEGEQGISNRPNDEETDEEDDGLESHGA